MSFGKQLGTGVHNLSTSGRGSWNTSLRPAWDRETSPYTKQEEGKKENTLVYVSILAFKYQQMFKNGVLLLLLFLFSGCVCVCVWVCIIVQRWVPVPTDLHVGTRAASHAYRTNPLTH